MNTIQTIFGQGLSERVAVYVPGTIDAATIDAATAERMTERVAGVLSELFGGATIQPASGAWVSAEHGLIREPVNIVYSYTTAAALEQAAPAIRDLCEMVKREMRQEAVSLEAYNTLYFI